MKPGCQQLLFDPETGTKVGRVAHIHAASAGGPRWDASLSIEEVRAYENLVLLCGAHHDVVDQHPEQFTAEDLRSWRTERETESETLPADLWERTDLFTALLDWTIEAGYAPGPEEWWLQPGAPSFRLGPSSTRGAPPWLFQCSVTQLGGEPLAVIRARWFGDAVPETFELEEYEPSNPPRAPTAWRLPDIRVDPNAPGSLSIQIEFWFAGSFRSQKWNWKNATDFQGAEFSLIRS
jgi:hypothetical protein